MEIVLLHNSQPIKCHVQKINSFHMLTIHGEERIHNLIIEKWDKKNNFLYFSDQKIRYKAQLYNDNGTITGIIWSTTTLYPSLAYFNQEVALPFFSSSSSLSSSVSSHSLSLNAPLTGKIIKLFHKAGDAIDQGTPLLVIESMKMENEIRSERAGIIKTILIEPGDVVETNQSLILFEEPLDEGEEDEKD